MQVTHSYHLRYLGRGPDGFPPTSHCIYAISKYSRVKPGENSCILIPQKGPGARSSKADNEQYPIMLSRLNDFPCLSASKKFTYFVPSSYSTFPGVSAKQCSPRTYLTILGNPSPESGGLGSFLSLKRQSASMSTACTVLRLALLKVGEEDNKLVESIAGTPRAPDRCSLAVTGK